MNNKLIGLLLLVSVVVANSNLIPIQAGVPNTLSFACAPLDGVSSSSSFGSSSVSGGSAQLASLIQTLTSALGSTRTVNSNTAGYTYTFSGLPSWVTSVNGPVISGTPPASGPGSFTIQITITAPNGASTTQNVVLSVGGGVGGISGNSGLAGSVGFSGSTFGGNNGGLGNSLQINNIYNPLNPGSPYNPYNQFNPNGVNFGGNTGDFSQYYTSSGQQNVFNPNNPNSPFNPSNPNSPFNPRNPNSPFASIANPNSPSYNPTLASNPNLPNLLNPLNPNSIFYPNSPNYNPNFGFPTSGIPTNLLYAPQQTPNGVTTNIVLTPTPLTLTPPPSSSNAP
jgi:hypothetical protein